MLFSNFLGVSALAATTLASAIRREEVVQRDDTAALEARASTAICPAYNGKTYTDSNNVAYTVSCPYSNNGNVIGSTTTATNLAQCMQACDAQSGCNAANFHTQVNICYFIGTVGSNVLNSTYNCAVKNSASSSTAGCTAATSVASLLVPTSTRAATRCGLVR